MKDVKLFETIMDRISDLQLDSMCVGRNNYRFHEDKHCKFSTIAKCITAPIMPANFGK